MENASKALIIAGAILISILLISVGIMVMGSATGLQDQMGTQMSAAEIRAFNSSFTPYEGEQRGSQVRGLLSEISASNAANGSNGRTIKVTTGAAGTETGTEEANLSTLSSKVQPSSRYNVILTTNTTTGLIETVHIAGTFN